MHIPETIKNALLVFVVVMLVYVLYQRLLVVLGKKERDKRYVSLGEKIEWSGKHAKIYFQLYLDQSVAVRIYDTSGKEIATVLDKQFSAGHQMVEADCSALQPGRYYFRVSAPAHDSSIYFNIS
jgi:hypothetical protein